MKLIEKDLSKFEGKNILIRLDLNVPISNRIIQDTSRIDKILDTLKFLLNKNSNLILISHIGRPKGEKIDYLSLKPVANYLEKKLNVKVNLIKNDIFSISKEELFKNKKKEIIMLENIRYYGDEEKNDKNFAKKLASLGDIYVNEAFSCSHRSHASVSEIMNHIPSFAGILLNNPVGVGDHPNVMETIQEQLDIISKHKDRLNTLLEYFYEEE